MWKALYIPAIISRCSPDTSARILLSSHGPTDWQVSAVLISSKYGVTNLNRLRLLSHQPIYLTAKAPPKDLQEAEQFQLQLNVISQVSSSVSVSKRHSIKGTIVGLPSVCISIVLLKLSWSLNHWNQMLWLTWLYYACDLSVGHQFCSSRWPNLPLS